MSRYYDVEVIGTHALAPHVRRVDVRRVDGAPFRLQGGQFLMMHFEHEGQKMNRSYSVASPVPLDGTLDMLELCIALVPGGIGSSIVEGWTNGSTFTASGPHGRFILRPGETQHLVLVGTGSGIAPYRSMLHGIEDALDSGRHVDLVFGAREEERFLYDADWRRLAGHHVGFTYWRCASRARDEEAWAADGGVVGRVQSAIERMDFDAVNTLFYLCGNEQMVEDVSASLKRRGVDPKAIRTEAYVSPRPFGA